MNKIIRVMIGIPVSIVVAIIMFGNLFFYIINAFIHISVFLVLSVLFAIFFIKSSNLSLFFIKIILSLGISSLIFSVWVLIYNDFYILPSGYSWKDCSSGFCS